MGEVIDLNAAPGRSSRVRDAMGRILSVGDQVAMIHPGMILFTVGEITPSLDPRAPAGMIRLTLAAPMQLVGKADQPIQGIVRVVSIAEMSAAGHPVGLGEDPTPNGAKPS